MREIKFRAWDIDNKKMVEVSDITFGWGINWDGHEDGNNTGSFNFEHIILMQYTGLKDKNGKEIYEGDIIERHEEIKVVDFILGEDEDYQGYDIEEVFGKWKVIGNIYENPELIAK